MFHFSAKQKPVIASLTKKGHKIALTVESSFDKDGNESQANTYHFNCRRFKEFKDFWEFATRVNNGYQVPTYREAVNAAMQEMEEMEENYDQNTMCRLY
tara:strand:+ start:519 stop:815 length:297 start_codon:yes stop_codon:yes gene_type:complete